MRVFAAVRCSEEVSRSISHGRSILEPFTSGMRVSWIRPEQYHVTLRFFGGVPLEKVEKLSAALRIVAKGRRPIEVRYSGVGAFPNWRRPAVIWAGLEDEGALKELSELIFERTRGIVPVREEKEFKAHVTMGRVKERLPKSASDSAFVAMEASRLAFGAQKISRMDLVESILSPGGAEYRTVDSFDFCAETPIK
ncbi:MAG: RNA 2',3'-cyclic phosphodiesterase [Verrucomicrobiota bacterium]|nr:RNA 2',3'-cyclic phosphodiesterase [Verrucomicrobiota bacterium]